MGILTTTVPFAGAAGAVKVAIEDGKRRYLGLYAQTGSCVVSIGEGTHADIAITLAQGNIFEPSQSYTNAVYYSGAATELMVIQDSSRPAIITYSGIPLTYDSTSLHYLNEDHNMTLADPVFS